MAMRAEKPFHPEEKGHLPSSKVGLQPVKKVATRITIRCNVGFGNFLSIRGKGAGLCWDKGITLKNIGADEWIWETDITFKECEFKVLVNDQRYEEGENHHLKSGERIQYTPRF